MTGNRHLAIFEAERRRLTGLAYRMTGSVADSENLVQQAWIRWSQQDLARIEAPSQWLGAVVTRLCLDHLKSARSRRESYIGAWLPDPLVQDEGADAERDWIVSEDVSIALVLMLETLSPEMRAAFILRDGFDYSFDEIADIVGRAPATCRQLVSRARRKLAGAAVPTGPALAEAQPIVAAFWKASREGDMQALLALFADEIEVHTDGGGKVPAAINVLRGPRRAAGFFAGLARKHPQSSTPCPRLRPINSAPGLVFIDGRGVFQTTAFSIRGGRIAAIWTVRNPDKLRHVPRPH